MRVRSRRCGRDATDMRGMGGRQARKGSAPSDHAPVIVDLDDARELRTRGAAPSALAHTHSFGLKLLSTDASCSPSPYGRRTSGVLGVSIREHERYYAA